MVKPLYWDDTEKLIREAAEVPILGLSLIQNGSFEVFDSLNVPWCWEKIGTATLEQDTGVIDGYGGDKSLKVTSGGASNEGAQYTLRHLKPSTAYSFYLKAKATVGDSVAVWTTGAATNANEEMSSPAWTVITGSFITDSTPTDVVFCIGSENNGDIVWFDCLIIIEGPTPPDRYLPFLGSMSNLVDDISPQLGGELDCQAHSVGFTLQNLTGDGATTIDWRLGNKAYLTLGAQNETLTFIAPSHACNLTLFIKQDATGSRTITWPAGIKWAGKALPTLSTAANSIDIVSFAYDGTSYYGAMTSNFGTV